jgi:hypothetical protein
MQPDRTAELTARLEKHILVLDGAMGTMIQRHSLREADYRGSRFAAHPHDLKGNNDLLLLTPARTHPGDPCRIPGGRRRSDRDQHLQFDAVFRRPITTSKSSSMN